MITMGAPGSVTPETFQPGAVRCTSYQREGAGIARWGSFARSGFPLTDLDPLTTQPLLPPPRGPRPKNSRYETAAFMSGEMSAISFPVMDSGPSNCADLFFWLPPGTVTGTLSGKT